MPEPQASSGQASAGDASTSAAGDAEDLGVTTSMEAGASSSAGAASSEGPDGVETHGGATSSSSWRGGTAPADGKASAAAPKEGGELQAADAAAFPRNQRGPVTNLHYFHRFAYTAEPVPEGEFTKVPGWRKDCLSGKVYRYDWRREGHPQELTVVKAMERGAVESCRRTLSDDRQLKLADSETRAREDPLSEIGVYSYFCMQERKCPYVLQMLGCFSKDTRIWLVLENCEGGDLFDGVQAQRKEGNLGQQQLKSYVYQLLTAVSFIHQHNVGHRDISLENLLLRNGQLRLMDFGQAVRLRDDSGAPYYYFQQCGKDYYRAPEVYIPPLQGLQLQAMVPQGWAPGREVQVAGNGYMFLVRFPHDAVPEQVAVATLAGYPAAPIDVFAAGVVFFILHAQAQPWDLAMPGLHKFQWVYENGIQALLEGWGKPLCKDATDLLVGMLSPYTAHRASIEQCLASPWFTDVSQDPPMLGQETPAPEAGLAPAA